MTLTQAVRVVVVDDSPFDRRLIAHWLADDGSCVIVGEASDGEDAAAVVEQAQPDVVVLDLSMPRLGGLGIIGEVADASPGARIVVTSSGDEEIVRREVAEIGARFVSKDTPFALRRAVLGVESGPFIAADPPLDGLWATLRNVPLAVALCGAGDRILRVNDALCELVGAPAVRLLDHPCGAFLIADESGVAGALHDQLWSGARASYSIEQHLRRADGSSCPVVTRWWSVDDARFWDGTGAPTVVVVAFDPVPA